jgi:Mg2+-importing ATPase
VKLLCLQSVPDALCVNALPSRLGITQSAVSQHLRVLKSIALVKGEKRGYYVHYHINHEALERYRQLMVATLTGETYPAEKVAGTPATETTLNRPMNTLFMGTHVVNGSATAVVVNTGTNTEFGKLAGHLQLRPPETEFEHGVRRFGYLLMEVTLLLVIAVFVINIYLERPFLDSFLFSLALAVGLTPQLLPAIISVNLARGAKGMADHKVIVKRLASIENFGSMNVLCSDKTGTLTEGLIQMQSALSVDGQESDKVFLYAYLNAIYQTGYTNPIDEAIRTNRKLNASGFEKLDEVPYDFIRRRLSVLVSKGNAHIIITKGALPNVLAACSSAETVDGRMVTIDSVRKSIQQRFENLSNEGLRTLGIAYREVGSQLSITRESEADMTFLGFLVFFDPPKTGISETVNRLKQLGVSLKVISGDNKLVTTYVSEQVGLPTVRVLTGPGLRQMNDDALLHQVNSVDVFAEVEPNQKERVILALKKTGNVVGYMGDGINDASALHAADVGISVDSAVDVAKDAADIVLLEKDLGVLVRGVQEGRKTFTNTLKYVFMATSANFGNMFSVAGVSLFLKFLPLLPRQILLTNLMTDLPEMTIATDSVDQEAVERPRRWNIKFIRNFMITFGILSSVFDYLTFGALLFFLHAGTDLFRTGWFVESVVSASLVVLVIRSRRPFFRSKPSRYLLTTTLIIAGLALVIPFTSLGVVFGFVEMPLPFILVMLLIVSLYVLAAELMKRVFYRHARL